MNPPLPMSRAPMPVGTASPSVGLVLAGSNPLKVSSAIVSLLSVKVIDFRKTPSIREKSSRHKAMYKELPSSLSFVEHDAFVSASYKPWFNPFSMVPCPCPSFRKTPHSSVICNLVQSFVPYNWLMHKHMLSHPTVFTRLLTRNLS